MTNPKQEISTEQPDALFGRVAANLELVSTILYPPGGELVTAPDRVSPEGPR
jgi:hypothetical protein